MAGLKPRHTALVMGIVTYPAATVMTASLMLSLAGFWRQSPNATTVWLVAAAAVLVAISGYRRPILTLGLVFGPAALAVLATPFVDAALVARWDSPVLSVFAANSRLLLNRLARMGGTLAAGRFETLDPTLAWLFLALIGLAAALFIVREAMTQGTTIRSVSVGVAFFSLQWLLYYEGASGHILNFTLTGLMLWSVVQGLYRSRRWQDEGWAVQAPPRWGAALSLTLVTALVAALLPATLQPVDPGTAGAEVREALPWLQRLRGINLGSGGPRNEFSLAQTGFGDPALLGGPVQPDTRTALRVRSAAPLTGALYLRGSVSTRYTGRGWQNPPLDLTPVAANADLPSGYADAAVVGEVNLRITPVQVASRSLFAPLEPARVGTVPGGTWTDDIGNLMAGRVLRFGQFYDVQSRIGSGRVDRIKAQMTPTGFTATEMAEYLALPQLPRRVANLTRAVVRGIDNPVDQAHAVEQFLRTRYAYSLEAPAPPPGRDFVDQFLFVTREGYCTYFSTAMVVMLRQLGIPARWAQGFAVPATGAVQFDVPLNSAHAWVEAYFPGYGWVIFDPTPHPNLDAIDRQAPPDSTVPDNPEAVDDALSDISTDPATDTPEDEGAATPLSVPLAWIGWLAMAAGAVALGLGIARRRRLLGYRRDPALARQLDFVQFRQLLAPHVAGAGTLTAGEFARAAERTYPELSGLATDLATAYDRLRYGPPGALPTAAHTDDAAATERLLRLARRLSWQEGLGRLWAYLAAAPGWLRRALATVLRAAESRRVADQDRP